MKAHVWVCMLLVLAGTLGLTAPSRAQDSLSGTLTVYLQSYYGPAVDPETAAVAEEIAAAYEAEHPGVDIQLIENLPDSTDMETFLAARMAANQSPDIMWQQFATRNLHGDEWWVPLNEFFERPNPYIAEGTPGHERWADSFPEFVMAQTRAGDGNWYQVSLDWVESGLYYNKDLFAQANVDPANWTNWTTFVEDMTKIRETTGVDPLGSFQLAQGWSSWAWADDIFLTVAWADMAESLYMEKYNDPNRPWRQLNPEEIAKAILDGKLNATDPRMDDYLRVSKEFVSLLPIDYTSILSLEELDPLFYSGQLASVWTGTWKSKPYAENIPFEYGVTYLPPFTTADSPHAQGTAYRVGGPSSAGQYGIAQSAAANGKLELAIDFLMYLSAPQNFERLAVSSGSFIPMVAGASAPDAVSGFGEVAELPERLFNDPDSRLTLESADQWSSAMQAYFLGAADEEATKARLQEIWMEGATNLCAENAYDWCPAS